ncbi:MAG TPA: hypothetical protein VH637_24240 [Streptosporangiaceae bacterium]|jgi:hypothetical protein
MRRLITTLAAVVATAAGLGIAGPAAGAAPIPALAPFCGIHWGSAAKHAGAMTGTRVRTVRAGQHACYDRLVIELGAGKKPGYRVQYVAKIIQDGSGKVIPVSGGARLQITVLSPARAGFPVNGRHLVSVTGFRTFRQVAGAGSFEGITSFGLGVRAKLPFRVFELSGPGTHSRLVIDVAHRWVA